MISRLNARSGGQTRTYYSRRAAEYDRIYEKPERQEELRLLREHVHRFVAGKNVLDLACGTGYWTSVIAPAATRVFGIDISLETLRVAMAKECDTHNVCFAAADVYSAPYREGVFTAAVAGFWLSHVPRCDLRSFLRSLTSSVGRGSRFLFFDNRYVPGSSTPVGSPDSSGNTYQHRELSDGTRFRIMKNFLTREELLELGASAGSEVSVHQLTYYWILEFKNA